MFLLPTRRRSASTPTWKRSITCESISRIIIFDFATIPYVLQLNKRDLPNTFPWEDLRKELVVKGEPSLEAVAVTGQGVFDTLKEVAKLVLAELKKNS